MNLKKVLGNKKLVIGLTVLLIIFVIDNVFTFRTAIDYATRNTEYKEARGYMASALIINKKYIYPLTDIFGWDRLVIKPFYFLRDKLFDIGYLKFPKDEGEKEFWWYSVKFKEYEKHASQALTFKRCLSSKQNKLIYLVDDLYQHIDLLANAKITDKTDKSLAKQKLVYFTTLGRRYQDSNSILKYTFFIDNQSKLGLKGAKAIIPLEDAKKYEHVYYTYINLLNYSKAHEKESYEYFYSDPVHWLFGDIMAYEVINDALMSKLYNNKLDCNDKFIKIFTDYHREIREFASKNENNPRISRRLLSDARTVAMNEDPFLAYKCQNNPYMKDYIKYIFSLDDYKKSKTLENVKTEIVSSYKSHEEYFGRLKQLESIGIR